MTLDELISQLDSIRGINAVERGFLTVYVADDDHRLYPVNAVNYVNPVVDPDDPGDTKLGEIPERAVVLEWID